MLLVSRSCVRLTGGKGRLLRAELTIVDNEGVASGYLLQHEIIDIALNYAERWIADGTTAQNIEFILFDE